MLFTFCHDPTSGDPQGSQHGPQLYYEHPNHAIDCRNVESNIEFAAGSSFDETPEFRVSPDSRQE